MTHSVEAPAYLGRDRELLAGPRMDNLLSVHAATAALTAVSASSSLPFIPVLAAFDHEENGSQSDTGADGPLLGSVLERSVFARGGTYEDKARAFAGTVCMSSDTGHAVHPNYAERHDPTHHPRANSGPILKVNVNQRYATDGSGRAVFAAACERAGVPWQTFVSNNAMPCGTTIGPITAARHGIQTVDVGVASCPCTVRANCAAPTTRSTWRTRWPRSSRAELPLPGGPSGSTGPDAKHPGKATHGTVPHMVLLGHDTVAAHRPGPTRRTLTLTLASAAVLLLAGSWLLIQRYDERPPWADDVAYEAGFLQGNRVRNYDLTGEQVKDLLNGGCARLQAGGQGGLKSSYDPGLWVAGCLDGAAGRPAAEQGLFHQRPASPAAGRCCAGPGAADAGPHRPGGTRTERARGSPPHFRSMPASTSGSLDTPSGVTRTGTPQSCWWTWQAGYSFSGSSSQDAAIAETCSTPSPTDASISSSRLRSLPAPSPAASSSGGVADTSNRVEGP